MITHKNQYFPWFDWLRGALAITVMLSHEGLIAWDLAGNFSVQVFFALSGWLIGGILLKLDRNDLPRFYFNRALRIWVPYYLALFFVVAASLLKDPIDSKWIEFVLYKLSFVYNLFGPSQLANYRDAMPLDGAANHFWSVNAEEQFYLLAPLVLIFLRPQFGKNILVWVSIATLAWVTDTYTSIVLGVLAAVTVHQFGSFHEKPHIKIAIFIAFLASVYGLWLDLNYIKIVPVTAILLILLLAIRGEQNKLGAIFGGMSYPLYLNHWIGMIFAHALLKPFGLKESLGAHLISFIFNVALAITLYWFIDKRILATRSKLYTQHRANLAIVFAYGMVIVGCIFWLSL